MRNLDKRVSTLEQRPNANSWRPWHQVIVDGQSEQEAIAGYEAEHGPIGEDNVMLIEIVDP